MCAFVHLHNHTDCSILDGMSKIPDMVSRVKELGMSYAAITDHGVAFGIVQFHDECLKQGISPILGCEFYIAPGSRFNKEASANERKYYHVVVLIKDDTGYRNFCHLVSRANTEGFYGKPRIDWELLERFHEGLIVLSACVSGEVAAKAIAGDFAGAEEAALKYRALFGEDYYLEVQNHGLYKESVAAHTILQISKKHGIKAVCTNDTHYVREEDAEAHEWMLCLQTNKTIYDEGRMIYEGNYSIRPEEEMRKLFPAFPELFDNTLEVAKKCTFRFHYGDYRMPKVVIPASYGDDYFRYLEDETWKGWEQRYPEGNAERERAKKDIEYELSVVKQMGFAEYFLDTRKTIAWSRSHNILVGPGRGSAAGSRMCYCLGITDIDPIPYNLLFERFLNPERISMPDIDVDYDYSHKDEVVAFEAQSNGMDHFSKIVTFTTMLAKGVLRDCARVAGQPVSVGNKLASMVPNQLGITLKGAFDTNPELREYISSDPAIEKLWNIALKIEGCKKAVSSHACGHIPTPVPCEDLYPVHVDKRSGYLVCQYTMGEAEHLGNLKKDLLMLRNLTIISTAHKEVKKRYGIDVPLWNSEILGDKETLELIASGDTNGVFQLESEGMKKFMRDLKPSSFEDIIAGVSLYRPGPMDFIPDYIKGKKRPSSVTYLTPQLKPILESTYGQIVYQEQVMQIVQRLAGFTLGRADVVRKAMGKKKDDIMKAEREKFIYGYHEEGFDIPGCVANGISEEIASTIYDQMQDFAKYAFNKSHAACYAAIAMQTAYLKCHYPLEFYSGLLTSVMDKTDKLASYLYECKGKGVRILPPDINTSTDTFSVEDDHLCYGLSSIKGVGDKVVKDIIAERENNGPYVSLTDFLRRNPSCGKDVFENFIHAGAFDRFGYTRMSMALASGPMVASLRKMAKNEIPGQISIFDLLGDEDAQTQDSIPDAGEYDDIELLRHEKEATGIYISKHPVDAYEKALSRYRVSKSPEFEADEETGCYKVIDRSIHYIVGLVSDIRVITTKNNELMAFVEVEDQLGSVSVTVFPDLYRESRALLEKDVVLGFKVMVSLSPERGLDLVCQKLGTISASPSR